MQHMTACYLSNISAKYYKNPSMLSRVIAKNVGDVFLRHSVETSLTSICLQPLCMIGAFSQQAGIFSKQDTVRVPLMLLVVQ